MAQSKDGVTAPVDVPSSLWGLTLVLAEIAERLERLPAEENGQGHQPPHGDAEGGER